MCLTWYTTAKLATKGTVFFFAGGGGGKFKRISKLLKSDFKDISFPKFFNLCFLKVP